MDPLHDIRLGARHLTHDCAMSRTARRSCAETTPYCRYSHLNNEAFDRHLVTSDPPRCTISHEFDCSTSEYLMLPPADTMPTHPPSDQEQRREHRSNHTAQNPNSDALESSTSQMQHSLLGDKKSWATSPLGMPETWPEPLMSFSKAIMSFPYPACVFWGEAMVSLHNGEWTKATGLDGQGEEQRDQLPADAFNALSASLLGKPQKGIDSLAFSQRNVGDEAANHIVSISPLFDEVIPEQVGAHGSLVQLIPKSSHQGQAKDLPIYPPEQMEVQSPGEGLESKSGPSQLGLSPGLAAFDKHPFFNRFAEMLPTGLALLDHNAQAVFVNRTFHELTTHCGEDQHFTSWSQGIHPDDKERVLSGYRDAFAFNKQLRTEFRALGHQRPWRLLFMVPFDGDDIRHISIRDHGGFICCILDITCEKSAEFVEREAAESAIEARVRQERFIDMISHEIRNPLSAMVHCTEDINEAVSGPENLDISGIKEAIDTINICIQVSPPNL